MSALRKPVEAPDEAPDLPARFAARGEGHCMEPEIANGTLLVFERDGVAKRGDFVGLWFRPGKAPSGAIEGRWLKRLVIDAPDVGYPYETPSASQVTPIIVVEQLNLPRRYTIRCEDLLSVIPVIGRGQDPGDGTVRLIPFAAREGQP
jgi:hypothetical protein